MLLIIRGISWLRESVRVLVKWFLNLFLILFFWKSHLKLIVQFCIARVITNNIKFSEFVYWTVKLIDVGLVLIKVYYSLVLIWCKRNLYSGYYIKYIYQAAISVQLITLNRLFRHCIYIAVVFLEIVEYNSQKILCSVCYWDWPFMFDCFSWKVLIDVYNTYRFYFIYASL